MLHLDIRLLGPWAVRNSDGDVLRLPTRKTEALLAYLAANAGTRVSRVELVRLLWSDRGHEQAQSSLRQALAAIRKAWPDAGRYLHSERTSVVLDATGVVTDVAQFTELLRWRDHASLAAAAEVYRGEFLQGLVVPDRAFDEWRRREASRLRGLASKALAALLDAVANPARADASHLAQRLIEADPLNEVGHRALIAHFAARGEIGEALRRYEACRVVLDERLGVEPSSETRRLIERVTGMSPAVRSVTGAAPRPQKPSIAVLPFASPPEDRDTVYFAEGISEELIASLSEVPWLFVIAPDSSFAASADAGDAKVISRSLGVRYLLRGSVRRAAKEVRIATQLVDADTQGVLWAGRVEGAHSAIFELQRQVAEEVVGAISPRLEAAEIDRALRKRSDNLDAWDFYLRALPHFKSMTAEGHDRALRLLDQALAIDPDYAPAAGLAAWSHTLRVPHRWADPLRAIADGLRLARIAVTSGHDHADALAMGGYAIAFLSRDNRAGLVAIDEALSLNMNSARAYGFSGWVRAYLGDHAEAIAHFERALRLSPRDPLSFRVRAGLAFALMFRGRLDEAIAVAEHSFGENPNFSPTLRVLAAALAHSGRLEESARIATHLANAVPGITVSYALAETRFTREEDRALLESSLMRAGLAS